MKTRLEEHYHAAVRPALMEKFGYKNGFEVPKIEKIIINMGVGEAVRDSKKIEHATRDLAAITGQKPVVTHAKRANAAFKLRAGMPIGCKVTLRRDRMYEFMDRLVNIALPRVRDFRGLNGKSFDGRGNYAMGIKEQIVFPEIDYDQVDESAAWTSSLLPPHGRMTKRANFSPTSNSRSSKPKEQNDG